MRPLLEGKDERFTLKHTDIIALFPKKAVEKVLWRVDEDAHDTSRFNAALVAILSDRAWVEDEDLAKSLQGPMVKIAYHYIAHEKNPREKPLNPVANFHLGNGAAVSVKNINFLANPSGRGLTESCGIMVNYIYTFSWLSQIRRSFRWFDRVEIKGFFR